MQALHGVGDKGWLGEQHFIEKTPERPNVHLLGVWPAQPLLGRVVHGGAARSRTRSLTHASGITIEDFAEVKVAQLGCAVAGQEYVGSLNVTMNDAVAME